MYCQGDNCALRTFLAPRGQVPCYGTWRRSRTYRLPPVLPVVQPQIQQHVGASSVISRSTDFSRPHCAALSHLSRCPLNALMPGAETGSLPRRRSWRRHCLADVFAHDAVVLRALRGRLSTKSKLRRRGSRLRSLRSPHRSVPLRWLVALLPGSSKRRCNSRQRSRQWKRGRKHRVYGLHPTPRPIGQPTLPLSLPGTKAKSFEHKQVLEVCARRRAVQTLKSGGGITFLKASASSGAAFL